MQTLKASFFSWKPLETESLHVHVAEVQFMIDSCHLISRSNSNKDCDSLILVCF